MSSAISKFSLAYSIVLFYWADSLPKNSEHASIRKRELLSVMSLIIRYLWLIAFFAATFYVSFFLVLSSSFLLLMCSSVFSTCHSHAPRMSFTCLSRVLYTSFTLYTSNVLHFYFTCPSQVDRRTACGSYDGIFIVLRFTDGPVCSTFY